MGTKFKTKQKNNLNKGKNRLFPKTSSKEADLPASLHQLVKSGAEKTGQGNFNF